MVPRSIHRRISRASGTVRTEKIPGRSIPGRGGRMGAAPGDSTSLSYFSVVTSPVARFFNCTVLFLGEMPIASQFVRQSTVNIARNICSVDTSRLDSFSMTSPTW